MRPTGHGTEVNGDFGNRLGFSLRNARPVYGRDIWLALDDAHCDSRRMGSIRFSNMEKIRPGEVETYQRQLFYWLLIRGGPAIFSGQMALCQGEPATIRCDN